MPDDLGSNRSNPMTTLLPCPTCHQQPVHVHRYQVEEDYTQVGFRCPPCCPHPSGVVHAVENDYIPEALTSAYHIAVEEATVEWNALMQGAA